MQLHAYRCLLLDGILEYTHSAPTRKETEIESLLKAEGLARTGYGSCNWTSKMKCSVAPKKCGSLMFPGPQILDKCPIEPIDFHLFPGKMSSSPKDLKSHHTLQSRHPSRHALPMYPGPGPG